MQCCSVPPLSSSSWQGCPAKINYRTTHLEGPPSHKHRVQHLSEQSLRKHKSLEPHTHSDGSARGATRWTLLPSTGLGTGPDLAPHLHVNQELSICSRQTPSPGSKQGSRTADTFLPPWRELQAGSPPNGEASGAPLQQDLTEVWQSGTRTREGCEGSHKSPRWAFPVQKQHLVQEQPAITSNNRLSQVAKHPARCLGHSPGKPDRPLLSEHFWPGGQKQPPKQTRRGGHTTQSLLLSSSWGQQEQAPCSNAVQPSLTPPSPHLPWEEQRGHGPAP